MESIFENPILLKVQEFGQKLGANKFLSALQGAMMASIAIIMVGAVSQIICAVGPMLGLFQTGDAVYNICNMPYNYTMNLIAIWVIILLAYNYAKNLKLKSPVMNTIDALICFLLIAAPITVNEAGVTQIEMTYLGAQGLFVSFLVVFASVRIEKFCMDKNIRVKMPDVVPSFLQDGFTAILPLLFSVIIFEGVNLIISAATGGAYNICSGFMAVLAVPLGALVSVPGMFVLNLFAVLLWCFGIHGSMITLSITMPVMMQVAAANAEAFAAGGTAALVFSPIALFSCVNMCGGTGNTMALVLLGLRSKSKQISAVSKISLVPSWFGVNEPLTFGMPIMYNIILCIPYILSVPVIMILTYIGYQTGILIPAYIPLMSYVGMGVTEYLGTLNIMNAVWPYLMLAVSFLVWYPFFKIYEKQCIAREQEAEALEAAQSGQAQQAN